MSYAEHLLGLSELLTSLRPLRPPRRLSLRPPRRRLGNPPSRSGQDGLGGEGDAGELSSGGYPRQRLGALPGLGAMRNSTSSTPNGPTTGLPPSCPFCRRERKICARHPRVRTIVSIFAWRPSRRPSFVRHRKAAARTSASMAAILCSISPLSSSHVSSRDESDLRPQRGARAPPRPIAPYFS